MFLLNTLTLLTGYFIVVCLANKSTFNAHTHKNFHLLPKVCGNSYADRIIGGSEVPMGEFPWLARVGYRLPNCSKKIIYRCGGALITSLHVLTAAHCVVDLPTIKCPQTRSKVQFEIATIMLGEHNTQTNPDCQDDVCADPVQILKPQTITVHRVYNDPEYANDISLIRLNKAAKINGWVSPICLPYSEKFKDYKGFAEVAGWGTTDLRKSGGSTVPMVVKIPVLNVSTCQKSLKFVQLSEKQICAGGEENKDSCGGDSGGPLMYVNSDKGPPKFYAIGLVSFGDSHCGKKDKPAVYTRVNSYIDWILDNITN